MTKKTTQKKRLQISLRQIGGLILPWAQRRILDQIKSVAVIVPYLILFQIAILGIPIAEAAAITTGITLVIVGLTFFIEGLLLGLMPLGELIGVRLPGKAGPAIMLAFAFILGVGVTFAEPAIGVLKAAGSSVKAWEAPLLFLLLNRHSDFLVWAVGGGVGVAVVSGMLRFMYDWSLKPFTYVLVGLLSGITIWAYFDPSLRAVCGLAWDCGGVTTGPVTVPLVLALGIGVCRVVGKGGGAASGFGVVTLASLFPILAVLLLGIAFLPKVSHPMSEQDFFAPVNQPRNAYIFGSTEALYGYSLVNTTIETQRISFGSAEKREVFIDSLAADKTLRKMVFGSTEMKNLERWALDKGTAADRRTIFGSDSAAEAALIHLGTAETEKIDIRDLVTRNTSLAIQAIIPLTLFLLLILAIFIREKLPHADEIVLGVLFAVIGMALFNIGIEQGLAKLGSQIGGKLPCSFKSVAIAEETTVIREFDTSLVQTAINTDGTKHRFFNLANDASVKPVPFTPSDLNIETGRYIHTPHIGPLFGTIGGIFVVILFAFLMGYGATLAEPALNALGMTVEELTVGAFRKGMLMQAVAVGVGTGIAFGIAKLVWDIPLVLLLLPPYVLVLILTFFSDDDFVNIGWDSAGVTTGPVTVPLVLAMGLGVGNELGLVEGFGILALASAWPILTVLSMGILMRHGRKQELGTSGTSTGETAA